MDLRFHPRTKKQRDLRFEPRQHGCGYPNFVPSVPPPPPLEPPWDLLYPHGLPRRRPALSTHYSISQGGRGIPPGTITQFWGAGVVSSPLPKTEPPPPPKPNAVWDEGPGSLFD